MEENIQDLLVIPHKHEHHSSKRRKHKHRSAKEKKKRRCWWIVLLALLLALAVAVVMIPHLLINSNIQQASEFEESELAVTPNLPSTKDVQNIALFGIDQKYGSVGRSDVTMIVSIDRVNNKIKMTSIARDSLVPIAGHGEEKLTHAWAYGHAKLAVKTLNKNFGLNITDYAYINFNEFVDAIDYMGGVYVDLTEAERVHLNKSYNSWYQYYGEYIPKVEDTGRVLLKGAQALSYSRDRTNGGDTSRTGRQREVLMGLYERAKNQPLSRLPGTVAKMMQLCHTNLTSSELLSIATWALTSSPEFESLSLPSSELKPWRGVLNRQTGWVYVYDLDAASTIIHNFVYEEDLPVGKETTTTTTTATAAKGTTTTAAKK